MAEDRQYSQVGGGAGPGREQIKQAAWGFMAEDREHSQHRVSWQRTEDTVSTGFHGRGQRTQSAENIVSTGFHGRGQTTQLRVS